jgi:hypothetical protein
VIFAKSRRLLSTHCTSALVVTGPARVLALAGKIGPPPSSLQAPLLWSHGSMISRFVVFVVNNCMIILSEYITNRTLRTIKRIS